MFTAASGGQSVALLLSKLLAELLSRLLSGALWIVARLPAPVQRALVVGAGRLYARFGSSARKTIITNIEHLRTGLLDKGVAIDPVADFAQANLQATMRLLDETAICWRGPPDAWRALIDSVQGEDAVAVLAAAYAQQQKSTGSATAGVLLLSPHLGNWELLNMYLGAEFGVTVLYDPPKIAALDPLIRQARERTRSKVLPIGAAGLRGMVQRLRAGGVVGLLPDQVPEAKAGVLAEFFGKQALTINLVHRLVSRHHPRVFLVCALRNANGRFDICFDELTQALSGVGEAESARAMNAAIEKRVASAPEQYQWSYKRFKRVSEDAPNIYRVGE